MREPSGQDDIPNLGAITAYKGVVVTDDRRSTLHDYRDIGEEYDG